MKPSNDWTTILRGEDVDLLLTELRAMQAGDCGHQAPGEQRLQVAALRVYRRICEIGGVIRRPPRVELSALIARGCGAVELESAGYAAGDVKQAGKSAREMRGMGWRLVDLIGAGFGAAALLAADYSPTELRDAVGVRAPAPTSSTSPSV